MINFSALEHYRFNLLNFGFLVLLLIPSLLFSSFENGPLVIHQISIYQKALLDGSLKCS